MLLRATTEVTILFVLQQPQDKAGEEEEGPSSYPHERCEGSHEGPSMATSPWRYRDEDCQPRSGVRLGEVHGHGTLCRDGYIPHHRVKLLLRPPIQPLILHWNFSIAFLKDHYMLCMMLFDIATEKLLNNWLEINSSQ